MRFSVEALRAEKGAVMLLDMRKELPPIDLGRSRLSFVGPVEFVGQATNTGRRIVVMGSAKARALAFCDRCLEEFAMDLATPISESYYRADEPPAAPDEDERVYGDDDVIDMSSDIEQAFVLALPIRIVCRDDCRGLCPRCGHDLNRGECSCSPCGD
ncbi:MAG TPA: metal-binding protein [Firmicutes bacterium]|jgi:uncharacterized protein|nr:metal-binding protein [Bacillota bacterium]HBK61523.1 metal-binding protein [Bacillota bacterium]